MEISLQQQYEDMDRVRALLQSRYGDRIPLAHVHTYGCQQNVSDSEKLKGMLAQMGYGFCDAADEAELVLYNTCAVRENAEDRVFGNVGALKAKKRRNPNMIIALCGCMVQQPHIAEKLKKSFPYVDLVFGTHKLKDFPSLLYRALTADSRVFDITESSDEIPEGLPVKRDGGVTAWLPIMYGCNNFCTYCIVPYVRGRERSRKSEEIVKEFQELLAAGYKEITLLGQNVNSYGKGLEEEINFAKLLRKLNAIPGDFRIRFMTSHPKDASHELIDTIADCEKVCNHFHLPVQCGSDRILRLMNRGYTTEDYLSLVRYAREKIPDLSFTSDIIVGFPGETEEDFAGTLDLISKVGYDSLFSFIYSKRVGTKAAAMPDPTTHEEKTERFARLLEREREIAAARLEKCIGKTYRVLAEDVGRSGPGMLSGRTEQHLLVEFPGEECQIGQFLGVEITQAQNWALYGIQK